MANQISVISVWDYMVLLAVFLISALIGIYFRLTGGKQRTVQEYLLADGQMSALPVAFSLMASFISAITILGVSAEVYNYGTQFLLINLAYVVGTPIVCYIYLPVFYKLRFYSVYEYLERRFGKWTRIIASFAFLLQMIMYMGIVLYAPALALSAVTGLNKSAAILTVGTVCAFYSTIGGMKAVLFADLFQSILMIAAVVSVIIQGAMDLGGFENIWKIAAGSGQRLQFFNISVDPTERHTVFTQLIGGLFMYLSLYAVNQTQIQRLLCTKDLQTARRSLWYSLPVSITLSFLTGFAGLVIYARYKDCDPIFENRIYSSDQLLPLFVIDSFHHHFPGLTGLFIAGVLSGSLSTISSSINSLAAVTFEDYLRPLLKSRNPRATTVSLITKFAALIYGVACVGIAYFAENFTGVLQASLTILGIVGGSMLSLFTIGIIFPFCSQPTVVPAFIGGILFTSWMGFGSPRPTPMKLPLGECKNVSFITSPQFSSSNETTELRIMDNVLNGNDKIEYTFFFKISYQWYPLIGFTLTILIALVLSVFIKQKRFIDASLLAPMIANMYINKLQVQCSTS